MDMVNVLKEIAAKVKELNSIESFSTQFDYCASLKGWL